MKRSIIIALLSLSQSLFAATTAQPTGTLKITNTGKPPTSDSIFPDIPAPKLKKDEYSLYFNDTYVVFKTKNYEKLDLSENCFKNKAKPDCTAYKTAQVKPPEPKIAYAQASNMAAISCENMGGRNLIGKDFENKESNFCRFSDGSMVTSWSMFFKHNPVPVIK